MARKSMTSPEMMDKWKYHHIKGDLLTLWENGNWIAVPTNGSVNKQGLAVMGAGVAKQVVEALPDVDIRKQLGRRLRLYGNVVHVFPHLDLITVPVKHEWNEDASLALISRSLAELNGVVDHNHKHYGARIKHLFCPRFGCGNGNLSWSDVEPLVAKWLGNDSRFTLVSLPEEFEEHYGRESTERSRAGRGTGDSFRERVPPSKDR